MPSGIAATMLAEMTYHRDRCYRTFDWTVGSQTFKLSDQSVASTSAGMYLARIPKGGWGQFRRPDSDSSYHLSHASGSIQIQDDPDETFGKAIGGPLRGALIHSTASAYVRSPEVPAADHYQFFTGRVFDWGLAGPRLYQLDLGPDSLALEQTENNILRVNRSDWPLAPLRSVDGRGTPGQIVYGKHRSAGLLDSTGLVPTIPVDIGTNYWLVSIGSLPDNLVAVWKNGVQETLSNWNLEYLRRNGIWYTVLRHIPATADQDADEITCDLDGAETFGDGSTGTIITNPVDILQHFLVNFAFGNYPTGSVDGRRWLAVGSFPINTTSFNAASGFVATRTYVGSRVLTSEDSGISVMNEWGESHKIGPFWTHSWKLGLNYRSAPINLSSATLIRLEQQEWVGARVSGRPQTSEIITHVETSWILDTAANRTRRGPRRVVDAKRTPVIKKGEDAKWVQAAVIT